MFFQHDAGQKCFRVLLKGTAKHCLIFAERSRKAEEGMLSLQSDSVSLLYLSPGFVRFDPSQPALQHLLVP